MYPVNIPVTIVRTGFSVAVWASIGIALLLVGLVLLRAATVRLDPDARR